ncbi:imidazole glycerol phosphate synthase subunit HisH [Cellulomonas sp. P5_C6]
MPAQPLVVVLDHGPDDHAPLLEALAGAGAQVEVTADKRAALAADGVVIAGSGPFADVVAGLLAVGADQVVDRRLAGGRPVLAIGVGMHVMFAAGPGAEGLGEWPGSVEPVAAAGRAQVEVPARSRLFVDLDDAEFHFAHAHAARTFPLLDDWPADTRLVVPVVVWSAGPDRFVAAVENGPLTALQLHPEHSGDAGARVLARWVDSLPTTHGAHA